MVSILSIVPTISNGCDAMRCLQGSESANTVQNNTMRAKLARRTALGRLGTPDDVVGTVAFLASSEAGFITGQVLTADGGG